VRHPVPTSAVLLTVAAVLCFALLDVITKFTTALYAVAVLVWARYAVQFLAMLLWLGPSMRGRLLHTRRLPLQLVRSAVLLLSSLLFVSALRALPLADATALNYSTPVLVVLLAVPLLGERMSAARVAFVAAGVVGMLLIVRPGTSIFQNGSLYALAAAGCYAVYQILTRLLAGENPRVLLFYPALVGTLVMSLLAPTFDWPARMPWQHAALIVLGGLAGTLGHFLFIHAFRHAPASAITPFTYVQLVFATLAGWIVYGHFPGRYTLLGMAVIGGSGLIITLHEWRRPAPALASPAAAD
jgi:drug/metabolite transporter (DMT)-like permease